MKRVNKKLIVAAVSCVVLFVGTISSSLAWLLDKTSDTTNTFTTSGVNITLSETKPANSTAKMIPGWTIAKDPKVTVIGGSEDCYVFVKIDKSDNYDKFLADYVINSISATDKWTALTSENGVYYRIVKRSTADQSFYILEGSHESTCSDDSSCKCPNKNGYVKVLDTVTNQDMAAVSSNPTLKFTAYAIQLYSTNGEEFTPAVAWQNVKSASEFTP